MTAELGCPPPATHGTSAPGIRLTELGTVDAGDEDGWSLMGRSAVRRWPSSHFSKTTGARTCDAPGMTSEPLNDADDTTASAASDAESFSSLLTEWNEAIVANDPEAIGRFAEPDWVFVGENGIFPGDQFLDSVAKGRVTHDFMTSDVHDVRVYGDVAIVTARVRNSGTFEGNPFQLDEWSTDVFIRRADGWRCAVTHLTSVAASSAAGTSPDNA